MPARKPFAIDRNVRPGGGRKRYTHALTPLSGPSDRLSAEEKVIFETIREHAPHGLLGECDRFMVEALVRHVCLHTRAIRELDRLVVKTATTQRMNPLVQIADGEMKIIIAASEALGLTPGTRQKLKLPLADSGGWGDVAGA